MHESTSGSVLLLGSGTATQYTAPRCGSAGHIPMPGGGAHDHVFHAFYGALCGGPSAI